MSVSDPDLVYGSLSPQSENVESPSTVGKAGPRKLIDGGGVY